LASAPMFTCAFWALTLAVDANHRTRARNMLMVFMSVATIHFLGQTIYCYHDYRLTTNYDAVYTLATALVFPVYYLYLRVLTDSKKLNFKSSWILLPSILLFASYLIVFLLMSPVESDIFCRHILYKEPVETEITALINIQRINVILLAVLFNIQIPFVAWFGVKRIINYRRLLSEYYSNPDEKLIAPVKSLMYCFVITAVASIAFNSIGRHFFTQNSIGWVWVASASFVTLLYSVGFVGFRQQFSIDDMVKDIDTSDKNEIMSNDLPGQENSDRMKILENKLIQTVKEKELYLKPNLKISDVAADLCTNRAYISRIVNQQLNLSFSDFINGYRVEYAKKLLETNPAIDNNTLAASAGFGSTLSMQRVFQQFENISLKEYRK
ncbi:helix-turn-helix domain-containing protein, partial [Bacteroidales bacterium OttesenSCG-928-B11]|nr:helix-turn-helix domain-containing protein [Bacteroidales bacterium OttesenSCG-928-B11]